MFVEEVGDGKLTMLNILSIKILSYDIIKRFCRYRFMVFDLANLLSLNNSMKTSDLQVLFPQSSRYEGDFHDPFLDKEPKTIVLRLKVSQEGLTYR